MATAIATRKVGSTEVAVSEFGLGTAPLGDLFTALTEEEAQAVLRAAWDSGVRYYDTAPFYGHTKSEHRTGWFLRQQERGDFVLSTKVGRIFKAVSPERFSPEFWSAPMPFDLHFDYSYDGVMRSWEDSLQRMGLERVDMLLIHDLDIWFNQTEQRVHYWLGQLYTSGWRALAELKASGRIGAIGAGINENGMIRRFLETVPLDFFIVALPYTLLDQDVLDDEFPLCGKHGAGVVIGAPFASGILATGPVEGANYKYAAATPEILEKTRAIESVCGSHGVPLRAAALQFPLANPLVAAIIPGAIRPEHVTSNVADYRRDIPAEMWAELKSSGLIREDAPTP